MPSGIAKRDPWSHLLRCPAPNVERKTLSVAHPSCIKSSGLNPKPVKSTALTTSKVTQLRSPSGSLNLIVPPTRELSGTLRC